jgi:hypothetical protein
MHIIGSALFAGSGIELVGLRSAVARAYPRAAKLGAVFLRGLEPILLAAMALCVLSMLAWYTVDLGRPAISNWIEQGTTAIAVRWATGQEIYPPMSEIASYGPYPYGPLFFQQIGVSWAWSGGDLLVVKLVPLLYTVVGLIALDACFRRAGLKPRVSFSMTAIFLIYAGILYLMVRADGPINTFVALACYLVTLDLSPTLACVLFGLLGGIAFGFKLHGPLYIVPAFLDYLARQPSARTGTRILVGIVVGAAISFAPFLVPRTSLTHYIELLVLVSHDPILITVFVQNIVVLATGALIAHVMTPVAARDGRYWRYQLSVAAAGLLVSIAASKYRAGAHHLIPFGIYYLVLVARSFATAGSADDAERRPRVAFLLMCFLASYQPVTSITGHIRTMRAHWSDSEAVSFLSTPSNKTEGC